MKATINPIGLYATPENMDALMANMENFSGAEKGAFSIGMGLTWNYLASQVNEDEPEEEGVSVTMIFGEQATRLYDEGETSRSKLEEVGSIETYTFSTPEDMQQAMQLHCDGDGWGNAMQVDGDLEE
ncbi:hypothetical protein N9Y00_07060 [Tateyamaria sp.]|nr:hypothetical protein [Tateyamaria sp.]